MASPLRIGLLGASRIAPRAVIDPVRARGGDVVVTAIAASRLDRAQAYAAEHAIPAAVEGYAALNARDDVDVVYCALPPAGHVQPCLQALEAGKALLVEKPFALNADQAQAIAEAAEKAGCPALEAFHYRFHSLFRQALERVRDGAIGRVLKAEGVFEAQIARGPDALRWNPRLGGGGTMDLGCYILHALRTLIGEEPQVVSAHAEVESGVDATMQTELRFPGGALARTYTSMRGERKDWIELEGEAGRLRLERFVSPQGGGRMILTTASGVEEIAAEGRGSYDCQLQHLVEVMNGRAAPLTGGADAVATMRVLDAARTSAGLGDLL